MYYSERERNKPIYQQYKTMSFFHKPSYCSVSLCHLNGRHVPLFRAIHLPNLSQIYKLMQSHKPLNPITICWLAYFGVYVITCYFTKQIRELTAPVY